VRDKGNRNRLGQRRQPGAARSLASTTQRGQQSIERGLAHQCFKSLAYNRQDHWIFMVNFLGMTALRCNHVIPSNHPRFRVKRPAIPVLPEQRSRSD
jgi:hypothetical protein